MDVLNYKMCNIFVTTLYLFFFIFMLNKLFLYRQYEWTWNRIIDFCRLQVEIIVTCLVVQCTIEMFSIYLFVTQKVYEGTYGFEVFMQQLWIFIIYL